MSKISYLLVSISLLTTLLLAGCAPAASPNAPSASTTSPTVTGTTSPSVPATTSPGSTPSVSAAGTLEIRVTDAPPSNADVTSILVTLSKVEVHMAGTEETTPATTPTTVTPTATATTTATATATATASPTPPASADWITVTIPGGPKTFDLLKIKGVEEFLASGSLAAGKYTQVRLTIDKVMVGLGTASPVQATLPSGELKFVHPFDVKSGQSTVLVMDFDASQFVNVTGNGTIMVKPVIQLITK